MGVLMQKDTAKMYYITVCIVAIVIFIGSVRVVAAGSLETEYSDSADAHPVTVPAKFLENVDLEYCLKIVGDKAKNNPDLCPDFMLQTLAESQKDCTIMDGTLTPSKVAVIESIDIDGDKKPEYLFDIGTNFECKGAYSIFSCGSLDCPLILYKKQNGKWQDIGSIYPSEAIIEVLTGQGDSKHWDIRATSDKLKLQKNFREKIYYRWNGKEYQQTLREVQGYLVDISKRLDGFWRFKPNTPVLDTPTTGGEVIDRYGPEVMAVIIGEVSGAPDYYVSPCRACSSGFIAKSDIGEENTGREKRTTNP